MFSFTRNCDSTKSVAAEYLQHGLLVVLVEIPLQAVLMFIWWHESWSIFLSNSRIAIWWVLFIICWIWNLLMGVWCQPHLVTILQDKFCLFHTLSPQHLFNYKHTSINLCWWTPAIPHHCDSNVDTTCWTYVTPTWMIRLQTLQLTSCYSQKPSQSPWWSWESQGPHHTPFPMATCYFITARPH